MFTISTTLFRNVNPKCNFDERTTVSRYYSYLHLDNCQSGLCNVKTVSMLGFAQKGANLEGGGIDATVAVR